MSTGSPHHPHLTPDADGEVGPRATSRTTSAQQSTMQQPHSQQPTEAKKEPNKFLDLSLTQVIGGSLAAATAAALGSRLGVAGTIAGAAVISILTAVAGSLYTQSLRRTRDGVRTAVSVVKERVGVAGTEVIRTDLEVQTGPADGAGTVIHDRVVATDLPAAPGQAPRVQEDRETTTTTVSPAKRFNGLRPKTILIAAVGVFVLTMGVVFGFELLTGRSLSGQPGTTIEQVTNGGNVTPAPTQDAPSTNTGGAQTDAPESSAASSSEAPSSAQSSSAAPSSAESTSSSASPSESASSSASEAPETSQPAAEQPPEDPVTTP